MQQRRRTARSGFSGKTRDSREQEDSVMADGIESEKEQCPLLTLISAQEKNCGYS
jgi:hypothetical protein